MVAISIESVDTVHSEREFENCIFSENQQIAFDYFLSKTESQFPKLILSQDLQNENYFSEHCW